jgi:uncharacterized membrane protein
MGQMSDSGTSERVPEDPRAQGEQGIAGQPQRPAEPGHMPGDGHRPADPWAELSRLGEQIAAGRIAGTLVPAWRRRSRGEMRWPVTVTVVVAIVLQLQLSDALTNPLPHSLMPTLEAVLGLALLIVNPVRIERAGKVVRAGSIVLVILITAANAISAIVLIRAIVEALPDTASAGPLLASGASIWATNVIAFGLWYWEFDRGGPVNRAQGTREYPDLMFPQMATPHLAPPKWRPYFIDYLYLSFTNATAFSPTDVMPLARWAKMTMAVQSGVSILMGALVIARAVNILK